MKCGKFPFIAIMIVFCLFQSVRIWDPFSGKQLRSLWPSQTTSIMSVSYSKGYIACCYSQTLLLYKLGSDYRAKLLKTWNEHHDR